MKEKFNEATFNRPEGDRPIDSPLLTIDLPSLIKQIKNEDDGRKTMKCNYGFQDAWNECCSCGDACSCGNDHANDRRRDIRKLRFWMERSNSILLTNQSK